MGMAAGQARLLSITARISDNELRAQVINNNKMRLAAESSQVSENYISALNQAQYMFTNYDADNKSSYQQLTFNALTSYNEYNNQYALTNASGNVLLSESDFMKYKLANGSEDAFLKAYGIERSTSYFSSLKNNMVEKDNKICLEYKTGMYDDDGKEAIGYIGVPDETATTATADDLSDYIQDLYEGNLPYTYDGGKLHPGYISAASSNEFYEYTKYMADYLEKQSNFYSIKTEAFEEYLEKITASDDEGKFSMTLEDIEKSCKLSQNANEANKFLELMSNFLKNLNGKDTIIESYKNLINDFMGNVTIEDEDLSDFCLANNNGQYYIAKISNDCVNLKYKVTFDTNNTLSSISKLAKDYSYQAAKYTTTKPDNNSQAGTYYTGSLTLDTSKEISKQEGITYKHKTGYDTEKEADTYTELQDIHFYELPSGLSISNAIEITKEDKLDIIQQIIDGLRANVGNIFNYDKEIPDTDTENSSSYKLYKDAYENAAKALSNTIFGGDIGSEHYSELSNIDNIWANWENYCPKNIDSDTAKKKFTKIYDVILLDYIMDTYGEPKYTYIDKNNGNENADAKAQWYMNLFSLIQKNGCQALQDGLASSPEWMEFAFESGLVNLQQVDSYQNWNHLIYTNCSDITQQTNDKAIAIAEAEYKSAMNKIENKDKRYDLELKNIDTEHNSLQVEYESIKTAIGKNIERTFKIYS